MSFRDRLRQLERNRFSVAKTIATGAPVPTEDPDIEMSSVESPRIPPVDSRLQRQSRVFLHTCASLVIAALFAVGGLGLYLSRSPALNELVEPIAVRVLKKFAAAVDAATTNTTTAITNTTTTSSSLRNDTDFDTNSLGSLFNFTDDAAAAL